MLQPRSGEWHELHLPDNAKGKGGEMDFMKRQLAMISISLSVLLRGFWIKPRLI
jgi:hypothetical protein